MSKPDRSSDVRLEQAANILCISVTSEVLRYWMPTISDKLLQL